MSQTPSTEEIMQRIRFKFDQANDEVQPVLPPSWSPTGTPRTVGNAAQYSVSRRRLGRFGINDFALARLRSRLRWKERARWGKSIRAIRDWSTTAIQLMKKVMRRSLTWYTRPIHYFQGGVIRASKESNSCCRGMNSAAKSFE